MDRLPGPFGRADILLIEPGPRPSVENVRHSERSAAPSAMPSGADKQANAVRPRPMLSYAADAAARWIPHGGQLGHLVVPACPGRSGT